ncbi:sensor domain-containing protein [Streptomyces sp. NBC_01456]|uniref:sensor domain-containing protein n=1 Tax=unclassified Streptomyces TaxID=2593676 RepID=UPI002E32D469|nr:MULTISPECIES: sensor domain-containing protein [unclassified Streptomyces]
MISLPPGRLRLPGSLLTLPLSAAPWLAAGYLASYLVAGGVLFAVATAAFLGGVVLSQFTVTVPLVVGSAWVIRGCAQVERGRALLIDRPIPYRYQEVTEPGLTARLKARCADPAIVRDCAYLILLFPPLLLLDLLALVVWLVLLGLLTLPLWYWAVTVSGGSAGQGHALLAIDTLPGALAVGAVALVLLPLAARLLVTAARLHLAVAQAVLRPPGDPLAQIKGVLARPGPLSARSGRRTRTSTEPTSDWEAHEPNTGRAG